MGKLIYSGLESRYQGRKVHRRNKHYLEVIGGKTLSISTENGPIDMPRSNKNINARVAINCLSWNYQNKERTTSELIRIYRQKLLSSVNKKRNKRYNY
jgi:hypothetical protein